MNHDNHLVDALDLLRARISGQVDAQAHLLDDRSVENEVCCRAMLFAEHASQRHCSTGSPAATTSPKPT